jgi:exoribonuclease-2
MTIFALKEYNEWVAVDLGAGFFYKLESHPDSQLDPYDSVKIAGDSTESEAPTDLLLKKYNFLKFAGCKTATKKPSSSKKIFGIIDYTNKTQYGKKDNKFITLFRPLSFSTSAPLLIKTNSRLNHNVYAFAEQESGADILKCVSVCGNVGVEQLDIMSPFYATDTVPKRWKSPVEITSNTTAIDMTAKSVFSIDGDSTLDVDDAVHYEYADGFHWIGIHIADVSSALHSMDEAMRRTFLEQMAANTSSIYPDGVNKIDMISKDVGETQCSLVEGATRNVVSIIFQFDESYGLMGSKLIHARIINRRKMTYKSADRIFINKKLEDLPENRNIYMVRLIMDKQHTHATSGQEYGDIPDECISRAMVAKLMILYNTHIAKYLYETNPLSILRVHYRPPDEIDEEQLVPNDVLPIIQRMKSYKGYYRVAGDCSPEEVIHSSLGLTYYTHATSPIRRFVDLWNQICLNNEIQLCGAFKIRDHIHSINWRSFMIKRAYEQMNLVNIFQAKRNEQLDPLYEGIIIGIDDDSIKIYIKKLNRSFMFRVYNKGTDYCATDKYIQFMRHDYHTLELKLYQKIVCRIFIKTDQYAWSNKVSIELLEPSFSNFLLG